VPPFIYLSTSASQIIVWVLAISLLLWAFWGIYCLFALLSFRDRMRNRLVGLSVLFSEKKDVLLSLNALFDRAKVPLEDADQDAAMKVRWLKTDVVKDEDVETINENLQHLQKRLALLSEEESYIKRDEDFEGYVNSLKDLDNNYHRIVALYNSDLTGYEYWRKRPLYFPIFWLFGLRAKKRLS
jgi:hypothetical protein